MSGIIILVINTVSMHQVIPRLLPDGREKLSDGFKDPRLYPPLPLG